GSIAPVNTRRALASSATAMVAAGRLQRSALARRYSRVRKASSIVGSPLLVRRRGGSLLLRASAAQLGCHRDVPFVARVLEELIVRVSIERQRDLPRLRIDLRVVDRHLVAESVCVHRREALDNVERVALRDAAHAA